MVNWQTHEEMPSTWTIERKALHCSRAPLPGHKELETRNKSFSDQI